MKDGIKRYPVNLAMPDTIESNHPSPKSNHGQLLHMFKKMKKRRHVPKTSTETTNVESITSPLLLLPAGTLPHQNRAGSHS